MNTFWRRFGIPSWSIRTRLLVGFSIVAFLTLVLVLFNIQRAVRAESERSLRQFLSDEGPERTQIIEANLNQVERLIEEFSNDSLYNSLFSPSLTGRTSVVSILAEGFDNELINSNLFREVVLLDENGLVAASNNTFESADSEGIPRYEYGTNLSENLLYQSVRLAIAQDLEFYLDLRIIDGNPIGYIVRTLDLRSNVTGYLLAELNIDVLIFDILLDEAQFRNTYSYIATLDGEVLAPVGFEEQARQSAVSHNLTQLGIQQQSGVESYQINGTTYAGYYQELADTNRFVIITEAPISIGQLETTHFLLSTAPLLLFVIIVIGIATYIGYRQITLPLQRLENNIYTLQNGDYTSKVNDTNRDDEIGSLARTFMTTRQQIAELVDDLQERITVGVRDLDATREVSRFAATQRDLQLLMNNVVNLITDKFPNIYHAQIFLIDDDHVYAVLRASTGEAGQKLLKRGHRLGVGTVSVIGQVTEEGRVIAARDIAASDVHRKNEFLPETRSELAIPLSLGEEIIGALDVQSKESNTFDEAQISILQTMSDQIAIAIENARLYEESIQRLEEIATSNQQETARAWNTYMQARRRTNLGSEYGINTDTDTDDLGEVAIKTGETAIGEITTNNTVPFAVPIHFRGQVLGAAQWELPAKDFDDEKILLAEELVNRLALSLDNARLFQESRRAVNRERIVNEITARLTEQSDIEDILQTAVREVGQALRVPQVSINLGTQENANGSNGTGQHNIEDNL